MKRKLLDEAVRVSYSRLDRHPMRGRGYTIFSFVVQNNSFCGSPGMNNSDYELPLHYGYQARERGWGIGFSPKLHAELDAWRKARGILEESDFEMINVRITDGGNVALSAPCACCCAWLKENGCKAVHFSTDAGFARIRP